jgi:D-glucuronyl C5-epimerase C-terminus
MPRKPTVRQRLVLAIALAIVIGAASVAVALTADHEIPGTLLPVAHGSTSVTGTVSAEGPTDDVYRISLGKGDRLTMAVDTSDTARLSLNLFDPDAASIGDPSRLLEAVEGSTYPLSWTHTATAEGSYFPDVRAVEGTATYTLTYRHFRATVVSLSVPEAIPYGGTVTVSARAVDSAGAAVSTGTVTFLYSTDQTNWKALSIRSVDGSGNASVTFKPSGRTYFKARFDGAGDDLPSDDSTVVSSAPRVYLLTPSGPSKASAWKTFTVAGYVKPRRPVGSRTVTLLAYRYEGDKWVLRVKAPTVNANWGSYSRYSGSISLPGSGPAKWRIAASVPADSKYAATTSGYLYVTLPMFSFKTSVFQARAVPAELEPFYKKTAAPISGEPDDVVMRVINGVPYDMALRQAESGYSYVYSYRLTGNDWYLQRARAQADRLISMHREEGDGWFFPSTFYFAFDRNFGGSLVPPWYSGIAQGAATGFFARLYETTGEVKYRDAAEHAMESFLIPRRSGHLWTSSVDTLRYLRLEEYPGTRWQYVFNGHMEAAMGLYDYYRITGDPRALTLYRGALTTVLKYGETLRNPGWISAYSLGARGQYRSYHFRVVSQMLELYTLTGDTRFLHLANEYDDDYPWPSIPQSMRIAPGVHTAYRFSSSGAILSRRQIRTSSGMTLTLASRGRIRRQSGNWLTIRGSSLDGYSLRETTGSVYGLGVASAIEYRPPVAVTMRAGRWKGQRVDAAGSVKASVTVSIAAAQRVTVEQRAVVNGSGRVLIASGPLAGYWVPRGAVILP